MASPAKKRVEGLKPFADAPMRHGIHGNPLCENLTTGPDLWHGVAGRRMAFRLPPEAKGPINAREVRAEKRKRRGD